jgi:hypothetical protein
MLDGRIAYRCFQRVVWGLPFVIIFHNRLVSLWKPLLTEIVLQYICCLARKHYVKLEVSFATYMGYKDFIMRSSAGNYHKEQSTYVFSKVEGMYVGWFIFEMCFNCCAINSFRGNDWR